MINTINQELCTGCGTCLKTCGLDVFRLDTNQNTVSPCSRECPAGTDMRAYNALMQLGMREEAAQKLKERNPFPAITGGHAGGRAPQLAALARARQVEPRGQVHPA